MVSFIGQQSVVSSEWLVLNGRVTRYDLLATCYLLLATGYLLLSARACVLATVCLL